MLKTIFLFLIIGVCVIVGVNKQLCGSCTQPIEIQGKYIEKIVLNKDRVREYSHLVKDVKDSKEVEVSTRKDLCLSIFNQSDFTLV